MVKFRERGKTPRFQPVSLENAPQVEALLVRLGLGPFDPATMSGTNGRNDNWSGTTETGAAVFVKQLAGGRRADRLRRTEAAWSASHRVLDTPRLIGSDPDHGLLVFEYVPDARSGAVLASDGDFDEALCARAGTVLAALHGMAADGLDAEAHPLPPIGLFEALPLEYYTGASAAELAMWRLLQADGPVVEALRALRAADAAGVASGGPIHADLRLDQFLWNGTDLYLTDFEEARVGDPARDVGAFAGEWLFQAVAGIPAKLSEASPFGHVATHEEIIATGVAEIERHAPLVRGFYRAYLGAAPAAVRADAELAVRAASYAGWHMVDRMLAAAASSAVLSPVNKAAAGIGRTVLLSPADFTSSLGLEA
ncbi:class V lanthionine synthetase subunit LxmK [Kitasatospora sp. NPDC089509]|uniref:class V lanthionine synthetase subunit LxmK n=1 Tax=Kitasatospora sp. NPDC089509 TaxID=3364079 RepID=UPI003806D939